MTLRTILAGAAAAVAVVALAGCSTAPEQPASPSAVFVKDATQPMTVLDVPALDRLMHSGGEVLYSGPGIDPGRVSVIVTRGSAADLHYRAPRVVPITGRMAPCADLLHDGLPSGAHLEHVSGSLQRVCGEGLDPAQAAPVVERAQAALTAADEDGSLQVHLSIPESMVEGVRHD